MAPDGGRFENWRVVDRTNVRCRARKEFSHGGVCDITVRVDELDVAQLIELDVAQSIELDVTQSIRHWRSSASAPMGVSNQLLPRGTVGTTHRIVLFSLIAG